MTMNKCCETCTHMFGHNISDITCCNTCKDNSLYDPIDKEEDTNGIEVQEG